MSNNTRITPDKVGKIAAKVATEAAYVITGLADIVAGLAGQADTVSQAAIVKRVPRTVLAILVGAGLAGHPVLGGLAQIVAALQEAEPRVGE